MRLGAWRGLALGPETSGLRFENNSGDLVPDPVMHLARQPHPLLTASGSDGPLTLFIQVTQVQPDRHTADGEHEPATPKTTHLCRDG